MPNRVCSHICSKATSEDNCTHFLQAKLPFFPSKLQSQGTEDKQTNKHNEKVITYHHITTMFDMQKHNNMPTK